MEEKFMNLFGGIPGSNKWMGISQINKGWSSDEKFYVKNIEGKKFLIRLNGISEFDKKQSEFNAIKLISSSKINMSNPIDFGDPWKEFNRLMTFSRKISIPFAKGQIDGYFTNEAPDLFFKVSALYTAYDLLFSIISTIPFGEEDIKNTICFSKMIFEDYNEFDSYVPNWYK